MGLHISAEPCAALELTAATLPPVGERKRWAAI